MFQNYVKIAWRHLVNQKMYSFVKIGGFSIGIAACMLIALFIKDELRFDESIPFKDRTYRLVTVEKYKGEVIPYTYQQAGVAKVIKEDYPEVEKAGRFLNSELFGAGPNQIRRSDKLLNVYEERFVYMDQDLKEPVRRFLCRRTANTNTSKT